MELAEHLESALAAVVTLLQFLLEAIAVFCVLLGLIKTGQLAIHFKRRHRPEFPLLKVRLLFGTWLALALEFQLGADILSTTVAPTLEALAKLGAIAVIRTFLNYFLNKELETINEFQESGKQHPSEMT